MQSAPELPQRPKSTSVKQRIAKVFSATGCWKWRSRAGASPIRLKALARTGRFLRAFKPYSPAPRRPARIKRKLP